MLCRRHLGAEAVHFHPLPGLCMGYRRALVPAPGLPATLEWAFGPKQSAQESRGWSHTAVPGPGWVFFTPGAQSGPRPLVDIDRDPAEITRGSWCPSSPFAFRGPAKTCRLNMSPQGSTGILTHMSCLVTASARALLDRWIHGRQGGSRRG